MEKYRIVEMGRTGEYMDFQSAILVKVIPYDFIDYYYNHKNDSDYEEVVANNEKWLMFKDYPGKDHWLIDKEDCEYWNLDLEDFIPKYTSITNHKTGEMRLRTIYQVIMVNSNLDVIEAKEKGISYQGKSGSRKLLESLDLLLIGKDDNLYYLVSELEEYDDNGLYRWHAYGIPDRNGNSENGMYYVDEIIVWNDSDANNRMKVTRVLKEKVGIYNYLTNQLFRFKE